MSTGYYEIDYNPGIIIRANTQLGSNISFNLDGTLKVDGNPGEFGQVLASTGPNSVPNWTYVSGSNNSISLPVGRIPYGNGINTINSSANFVFDGTNLGVGTSVPNPYAGYTTLGIGGSSSVTDGNLEILYKNGGIGLTLYATKGATVADDYVITTTQDSAGAYLWEIGNYAGITYFLNYKNNPMAFGTNGIERIRITNVGDVGIGTTTPAHSTGYTTLTVGGINNAAINLLYNNGNQGLLAFANTTDNTCGFTGFDTSGVSLWGLGYNPTSYLYLGTYTALPLCFYTNALERMRIDSIGNTYIGSGTLWQYAPAQTTISVATTLTASQLITAIINTTGTTYNVTLPTATAIDAGFVNVPTANIGFDFNIINTATGTITMVANTGIATLGNVAIGTGSSAHFRLRRAAAASYILYRLS